MHKYADTRTPPTYVHCCRAIKDSPPYRISRKHIMCLRYEIKERKAHKWHISRNKRKKPTGKFSLTQWYQFLMDNVSYVKCFWWKKYAFKRSLFSVLHLYGLVIYTYNFYISWFCGSFMLTKHKIHSFLQQYQYQVFFIYLFC